MERSDGRHEVPCSSLSKTVKSLSHKNDLVIHIEVTSFRPETQNTRLLCTFWARLRRCT